MSRHDLTDGEWNAIRDFLPPERPRKAGRPWNSHRQVINGILWVVSLGSPWPDLPEEFGKWKTVYNRFRRWLKEGLWDRILKCLLHRLDRKGLIDRDLWCVDGSLVRAHHAAAGANTESTEIAVNQGLGRSRGGFSTKLHLLTDGVGTPLGATITAGQRNESIEFQNLMNTVPTTWLSDPDWRPGAIAGDKGYSKLHIRQWLRLHNIQDVIAKRRNETGSNQFDPSLYRRRNVVERAIGWLKQSRRVATRYDKTAGSYLAVVKIAIIRRLLKTQLRETT